MSLNVLCNAGLMAHSNMACLALSRADILLLSSTTSSVAWNWEGGGREGGKGEERGKGRREGGKGEGGRRGKEGGERSLLVSSTSTRLFRKG